jgi:predicted lipoprotein with Yx(FWY)xxD motif
MASGTGGRDVVAMGGRTRATLILSASALAAGTLALSTLASSAPASAKGSPKALTLTTVPVPNIGKVLATSAGLTLYRYAVDPSGKATCTGACAKVWPPLLLPKGVTHLRAPSGVKGLSVVHVAGGRLQVFFHRKALYTFVSDKRKGQAAGQGVESDWSAALSNGKSSASAAAPTTSSPATGGGSSTPGTTSKTPTTSSSTASSSPSSTKGTTAPVTQSTSPPTTPPPTTTTTHPPTTTTTQPPTTTTTSPAGGGAGF